MSEFLKAIETGILRCINRFGQVKLNINDGTPLPLEEAPEEVKNHLNDTENNPHSVNDDQVYSGKSGTIIFLDIETAEHEITVTNGRITSWEIDGDEQLS